MQDIVPAFHFAMKSTQGLEMSDCIPHVYCNSDVKLVLAGIACNCCRRCFIWSDITCRCEHPGGVAVMGHVGSHNLVWYGCCASNLVASGTWSCNSVSQSPRCFSKGSSPYSFLNFHVTLWNEYFFKECDKIVSQRAYFPLQAWARPMFVIC